MRHPTPDLEIEEVFSDDSASEHFDRLEIPLKEQYFLVFFVLAASAMLFLFGFTGWLQIAKGKEFQALAQRNQFINQQIKAQRGIIYDRNKNQLVFNQVSFDMVVDKSNLPEQEAEKTRVVKKIAYILKQNPDVLKQRIASSSQASVVLQTTLSHQALVLFETQKQALPGIRVAKRQTRRYVEAAGLSHILGYMGEVSAADLSRFKDYQIQEQIGKEGLERTYEHLLREQKGVMRIKKTAAGKPVSKHIEQMPKNGQDLILGLDLNLQKVAFQSLKRVVKDVGATGGAVVALDPNNGQVLALVSAPDFNNNMFARGITAQEMAALNKDPNQPQVNRAIAGLYPSGSTIKPLVATAALEEGLITEKTKLFCPQELCLQNRYTKELECFADWKFHGWTDVKRAIAESVNPFFYIIAGGYIRPEGADERLIKEFEGLGSVKLRQYLEKFGWGRKTGIDLPGEIEGRISDRQTVAHWHMGQTYNMAIGQGYILVTPIQVARSFAAIANGGQLVRPHLINKSHSEGGSDSDRLKNPALSAQNREFLSIGISEQNIQIVRQGMRQAVSSPAGSAHRLSALPVRAAAKTGTAQTIHKDRFHNWITVFAPYKDPKIVLTILVENVPGMQVAAQTVAFDVLEYYFKNIFGK